MSVRKKIYWLNYWFLFYDFFLISALCATSLSLSRDTMSA